MGSQNVSQAEGIMSQIYLAINYGPFEGWSLIPHDSAKKALQEAKDGETHGNEWKILRELDIEIDEKEDTA